MYWGVEEDLIYFPGEIETILDYAKINLPNETFFYV